MKLHRILQLAACLAVGASLLGASAQEDQSFFARDRYTAVAERAQPEFDPEPLRAGAWQYRPELEAGLGYTSNLFATSDGEVDDAFAVLAPRLNGRSDWTRHELGFDLFARHTEYFDTDDESTTAYGASLNGRLDANSRLALTGGARAETFFEPRTAISNQPNFLEPVEADVVGVDAGADYEFGRVQLRGRIGFDNFDYDDVPLRAGGTADQDFRDRDQTVGTLRAAYAVERDWAVFAEARLIDRSYENTAATTGETETPFNRDSQGTVFLVGTDFELPVLLRGEFAVGYQSFEYDDPRFADVDGLSVDGRVQWFVTQLTTLTASANRRVIDPGLFADAGATETRLGVRADHELLRNMLLFGEIGVSNVDFENLDRDDDRFDVGTGFTYKLNKRAWVEAAYRYASQDSEFQDFTDNRVTVSLKLFP